ncbi:TVP38/TMEM64 family protein [Lutispora thermophila]|uniref:TVP38/TMEM64 family membrane protein n=1 Tax=Lutispora thermophila DSM 19022 TaxID=1122184 RepID=A0A1M6H1I6_9FIRM|nr:VTT domain-containing protein [Lutispora thermophila]SHJ16002.1 Uncharacterized membrane protein YdjX, TVP38/TMEM64 family, SNARE-associated domain [Lutispora thermophila DSM 19022]
MSNRAEKLKHIFRVLVVIGALICIGVYVKVSGIMQVLTSLEEFRKYIAGFGAKADLVFFIVQLASVIFAPIPSNVSSAAGAMIFGLWKSFIISTTAIILGSIIVFALARKFGKPFADRFVNDKVTIKYGHLLAMKGEMLLAIMLFLPFFPDDAICIVAGLSNIKFSKFLTIVIFTRPWGILVSSVVGSMDTIIRWWG